ncbi:MAG: hypothetical protein RML72_04375 [Bacteroidia bacterium]|nr:hypothetical protein [Bacteroidia bacterium]MDW8158098.1 hypothetical protein [Bacteroidia bacterium]
MPQDKLWKHLVSHYFHYVLAYFFPMLAKLRDTTQPINFLNQELLSLMPSIKQKYVDILAQVPLINGEKQLVLIHVEIQGYEDANFPKRMFTYFYRLKEKYPEHNIVSLVIFTDENPDYFPNKYVYSFEGTRIIYEYNAFKLVHKSVEELYVENNPFSVVLQVARITLEQRKKGLQEWKLGWLKKTIQELKKWNLSGKEIQSFLYFVLGIMKDMYQEYPEEIVQEVKLVLGAEENLEAEIVEMLKREYRELYRQEGFKKGFEEGFEEGIEKATIEGIRHSLQEGLSEEVIARVFQVSVEYIQRVKENNF